MTRLTSLLLSISFGFLASCEKQPASQTITDENGIEVEEITTVEEVTEGVETTSTTKVIEEAKAEIAEETAPLLPASERAKMLGFVGHLSPDVDGVMALYKGTEIVNNLRSLNLWSFLRTVWTLENGRDPEDEASDAANIAKDYLGHEMFLVTGKGAAEQYESFLNLSLRSNYFQFRMYAEIFANALAANDLSLATESLMHDRWLSALLDEASIEEIEKAQMPPLLAGLQIKDEGVRMQALDQLGGGLGFISEMGEFIEFEKGGAKFTGYKIPGTFFAEQLEAERSQIEKDLSEESTERIINSVKTKDLVISVGSMDDYVLVYIGANVDNCPIADSVETSLAATDQVAFIDQYKDMPIYGLLYVSDELASKNISASLGHYARGLRDGFQKVPKFGISREIVGLLDLIAEREENLLEIATSGTSGGVITADNGALLELFGGVDYKAFNPSRPHQLAGLGKDPQTFIFANWVSGTEFAKRVGELQDLMIETVYAIASKVATFDIDDPTYQEYRGYFQLFDARFRQDTLEFFGGLRTLQQGLGEEAAFVVDLKAEVPAIPGIPKELVENGRFPRASFVAPIRDREKISESWVAIEQSLRSMLENVEAMGLTEFSLPKATSSEKDSLATYYFDAFSFSDDVKPSVTTDEKWFAASTSRSQTLDLLSLANQEPPVTRTGAWFEMNIDVLRDYLEETTVLIDQHGDELITNDDQLLEFRERLPLINEGLKSLEEFDAITLHSRQEGDQRRLTLKFKTRALDQ